MRVRDDAFDPRTSMDVILGAAFTVDLQLQGLERLFVRILLADINIEPRKLSNQRAQSSFKH